MTENVRERNQRCVSCLLSDPMEAGVVTSLFQCGALKTGKPPGARFQAGQNAAGRREWGRNKVLIRYVALDPPEKKGRE